uniref:VWFA domain-containing protein n=1 Tax=Bicosoecida sp. CB-2014 TaxID=1486930 RepID=A0A7S1GE54_9STRA
MVAFYPELQPEKFAAEAKSEIIVLVDRSGSMRGAKMQSAKDTLRLLVSALPEGANFNIVSFGGRHESLFPGGSVPFTDGSKATALELIRRMDANMGGTNISRPLAEVFENVGVKGQARQVVLITDGQVRDTRTVIDIVKRAKRDSGARLFAFGIGGGVSHALVRGAAEAGGGSCEFVTDGERMQPKVMRMAARMLQPTLTNVRVDWGALSLVGAATPSTMPAIFSGDRALFFARLAHGSAGGDVTLYADTPDGPMHWVVAVDPRSSTTGTLVHTAYARSRISELEGKGLTPVSRAAVLELATTHNIACSEASFVAVEVRDDQSRRAALANKRPVMRPAMSAGVGMDVDDVDDGIRKSTTFGVRSRSSQSSSSSSSLSNSISSARFKKKSRDVAAPMPVRRIGMGAYQYDDVRERDAGARGGGRRGRGGGGGGGGGRGGRGGFGGSAGYVSGGRAGGFGGAPAARAMRPMPTSAGAAAPPPPPVAAMAERERFITPHMVEARSKPKPSARRTRARSPSDEDNDARRAESESAAGGDAVGAVAAAQRANGSWAATTANLNRVGVLMSTFRALAADIGCDLDAAMTMLVVEWLGSKHAASRDEWELVARKARRWISINVAGDALERHGAALRAALGA